MKNKGYRKLLFAALMGIILTAAFATPILAAGLKKIVAVSKFENKTNWRGQWDLDNGMADQLTDALIQSGQFVVLERQTLKDVFDEQALASSGATQKSKSARAGKLTSAQILVKGSITEYAQSSSGSDSGVSFKGFRIGGKKGEAHVGLIIRLIDTTTGEVLDSKRVEGKAKSGGLSLGGSVKGVGFGTKGFKKTPLGKATHKAIDEAVEFIADGLKGVPFQGRIIKVQGGTILISASAKTGASKGDKFTVFALGEELTDPETGELLGSDEEEIGTIKIVTVKERFSKAKAVGSVDGIKRGDIIRSN